MKRFLIILFCISVCFTLSAQTSDRRDVRKGNNDFRKERYKQADIDYRKALVKDSTSFAANYNLANTLYKLSSQDAGTYYDKIKEEAPSSRYAADYYFNVGDLALSAKDYGKAVEAFKNSLLINPGDLDAKENYIYAKKMLEDQDNQDNQDNQNDQNNQNNQDNQNNDRNDNDRNQDGNGGEQPQVSQQAAQQMLQAIQAKEKETQEKVNKEKALLLKSKQKEKNW